ncbi:hypothetical protein FO488_12690 [Geobacter sp. FeAm09]|uniref:DUF6268 family outer membrane beta-barrel protein n=1 Tax=Geobacter sp. FeAm09 TaxID=2597769 RepID=UPI0011ED058D|nr:DUF6268 family outer membrane beta-barrel protein [Geobacter sp. FeAm09]QEM68927.1 hypothetical protein FO488_12690 [Geobacter sp. FeAm09]
MKNNLTILFAAVTAWLATVVTPSVATAQTTEYGMAAQPNGVREPGMRPPLFDVTLESSYTATGKAKFRGADSSDSDAYNLSFALRTRAPLNEHWSIPLDLRSQNLYLGSLAGVPVPDNIHTLQFGTGLNYRLNDRWMFMALVSPTLYKLSDVGGNDIGISGGLMAMWNYSPSLKFTFGVMYSPDSAFFKVMPMAGLDWAINDQLDLRLMFPQPGLIYTPNDHWSFRVGADLNMATFRTSDSFGTSIGLPQYNDALGTYSDIRIGAGAGYRVSKNLSVEADAGYSVHRQINYTRIDERVKFDPAPYAGLGLRLSF